MGFLRTMCGLVALSAGLFYLTSASSLSDNGKWILIGITFASASSWVLIGGRPGAVQNQGVQGEGKLAELRDAGAARPGGAVARAGRRQQCGLHNGAR